MRAHGLDLRRGAQGLGARVHDLPVQGRLRPHDHPVAPAVAGHAGLAGRARVAAGRLLGPVPDPPHEHRRAAAALHRALRGHGPRGGLVRGAAAGDRVHARPHARRDPGQRAPALPRHLRRPRARPGPPRSGRWPGFFEVHGERCGPACGGPARRRRRPTPVDGPRRRRPAPRAVPRLPLEGVRVMDFGLGGVGVEGGRMLAEYGADVIKIESRTYPDFMRIISGSEMTPSFASSSRSQAELRRQRQEPRGPGAAAPSSSQQTDIVIENNSTGHDGRHGRRLRVAHELNPEIVMASSQLVGSRGTCAAGSATARRPTLRRHGAPVGLRRRRRSPRATRRSTPITSPGRLCAIGGLAVLMGRARHGGGGAHAEIAQVEAVVNTPRRPAGCRNRWRPARCTPRATTTTGRAPWGVFRCAGDEEWAVVCVRDDAEWQALRVALGEPDWAADLRAGHRRRPGGASTSSTPPVGAWCATRDRFAVAELLQAHGVAGRRRCSP